MKKLQVKFSCRDMLVYVAVFCFMLAYYQDIVSYMNNTNYSFWYYITAHPWGNAVQTWVFNVI